MAACLIVWIVICEIIVSAFGEAVYFGTSQNYACHCKNNNECNRDTGDCGRSSCEHGWMGPSCQYVNLAAGGTVTVRYSAKTLLNDGRDNTCSQTDYGREQTVAVSFPTKRWITEMEITTKRTANSGTIENIVVVGEIKGLPTVCSSPYSRNDSLVFSIVCERPILATRITAMLTLSTSSYANICEVRINGGINIAVKKPTNQTSNYVDNKRSIVYTSDLAVDGNTQSRFEYKSCSLTKAACDAYNNSRWTLNLETSYVPLMIRIYNRAGPGFTQLLAGFSLQTTTPGITGWQNIYTDNSADPGQIIILVPGQLHSISLLRVTTRQCQRLALCEVQMFTVCGDGSFGLNCALQCRCYNKSEACDKVTGRCSSGCAAGFTGDDCQTPCRKGWFGVNCQSPCGKECTNSVCDGVTGVCTEGCKPGYIGDMCDQQCTQGFYGESCKYTCSVGCRDQKRCSPVTGFCEGGCGHGWLGDKCTEKCPNGTFGDRCSSQCNSNCDSGVCDNVNGECSQGCVPGFQGSQCDQECTHGFYGESCKYTCSVGCRDQKRCSPVTGFCEGGCGHGWLGDKCTEKCPNGTFGDRCSSQCNINCDSGVCSNVNGECSQGCVPGFQGSQCDQACTNETYGLGCRENCSEGCLDGGCSGTDGTCQCRDGWRGDRCHLDCEPGFYGPGCAVSCSPNCAGTRCGRSTGLCSSCQSGWTGETCQQECTQGLYGESCKYTCSVGCRDQKRCSPVTGFCEGGCGHGWLGDKCTEKCPNGTFGDRCSSQCNINCDSGVCNNVNGECSQGCVPGFQGSQCDQACTNETYGLGCRENCSEGCLDGECGGTNGTCQCRDGWRGDTCHLDCEPGFYGPGCAVSCSPNCADTRCGRSTGLCSSCQSGWTGETCQQECTQGLYGESCNYTCSVGCRDQKRCSPVTGFCEGGCGHGWLGDKCTEKCPNGTFGDRCSSQCNSNCDSGVCSNENGECSQGCVPGFQGSQCDQECTQGFYGESCKYTCSVGCRDQKKCSPVTGFCEGGCGHGWLGDKCTEKCPNGTFGDGCSFKCNSNCNNGVCNNVNGECSQGCVPGFQGSQCDQACTNGTYGPGCREDCSEGCLDGGCDGTDGACQCDDGWRGDRCHLDCDPGYYGPGCAVSCSPNCAGTSCGRSTGLCFSCQSGWAGETCQQAEGMPASAIGGIVAAGLFIILLAVIIAVVLLRRKSGRKEEQGVRNDNTPATTSHSVKMITINKSSSSPTPKKGGSSQISLLGTSTDNNVDGAGEVYYNIASTSRSATAVSLEDFPQYVGKWRSKKQHFFDEFQKLPKDLINDHSIAFAAHNIKKNRYKNICAFDHSRVVLQADPGDTGVGDYINACYIDTPKKKNAFIAAQGPNDIILNDFIRMLWELDVSRVVMLTNLFEEGKQKCHQYWPDEGEEMFGKVSVSVRDTIQHADYTVRKFSLRKEGCKARSVTQFHYTAWPDKGVPKSAWSLLDFRDKVMNVRSSGDSPVVVHCSAGIGRTGTFIALQYLKEEAELSALQDVYTCVWSLRHQRVNMVQTKNQYVFIHEAALGSLISMKGVSSVDKFRQQYDSLISDQQRLQREFQTLQDYPFCDSEGEYSRALKNSEKNRSDTILAGDSSRAILMPRAEYNDMGGTYINAVFLPGFEKTQKFLQTQTPLANTVFDFWRMVSDYKVARIIMLDDYTAKDEDTAVYWPDVHTPLEIGPFHVKCINISKNSEIVFRQLELREDDSSMNIAHYTARFWPEGGIPSPDSLLQFVRMSEVTTTREKSPIIVHCRSGAERSGLFCAVAAILERVSVDQTVAVPVVVGNNKAIRKHNIPNVSQYTLCYKMVAEHLASESVYSNGVDVSEDVADEEGDENVYSSIEEPIYSNQ
ncbi:uncharacterized protein LOC124153060 isoform X4 [Haliotis rufescens]|uniref:uncharacterized protein LOC124153060 isoform X4 n=1 Tax=Haliotis rufescens TaxID=6454 RepID=UPI00201F9DD4|nr:uncharacterized protein LOC124153060 isoform X4 [Haliotis rufescens]